MQETLKLIQQVTSSILDNKNMSSFKLRSNNVKAHVTRINNVPPSTSNVNNSAHKKKQTLVIPRSAIQIANKPSLEQGKTPSALMQYTGALSVIGEERSA
jgi:hypothetical protein